MDHMYIYKQKFAVYATKVSKQCTSMFARLSIPRQTNIATIFMQLLATQ